ncbi:MULTISPECIES: nucleoside/nucleotide kinase family protein [Actinopolyspora]|uniref:Panthothenate kinase n=1 Tax=Actinopolyspora saharensis TaxID=995062 RepID=A0A1H1D359_9ACTN|nr:nucleoside/nucleotide kinase family protein [Actinopolyspora saharensis]NHD17266.1 nucleoside/nucleotide kinase family protein [Actinopolyspora sp. BKK2]NHE76418.1 nucleoside/nucleotide kinase family protein [Actinopolyspora sp. BKK1]SDQ70913.1 Panthothenate kinase [Actinopolyspora saharensis]
MSEREGRACAGTAREPAVHEGGLDELAERALALVSDGRRRILGIAGPPAAGKGRVADLLIERLGEQAVLVPMDGFHLAGAELRRLGIQHRKGAPDTFDAEGYVALLRRLRAAEDEVVYAPEFHREVEESYAGAVAVGREVPLVITEGNYLLLDRGPWGRVRGLLDECWFLEPDDRKRVNRLIGRHVRHGMSRSRAREWVQRSDERNAALVADTRNSADLVIRGDPE